MDQLAADLGRHGDTNFSVDPVAERRGAVHAVVTDEMP